MRGDRHCDEVCYTANCKWDGWDCGCAADCRYEELSECKEACLVIECGYGVLEDYAPCTNTALRMAYKFVDMMEFFDTSLFRINNHPHCSPESILQGYDNCNFNAKICNYLLGMCYPPTDVCERLNDCYCLECTAGLVNSMGTCQTHCAPSLQPHPLVPDFCTPGHLTSPADPMVFYVDSDYEGSERDGSRARPFNSLNEGLSHSSYANVKLLLVGSTHILGDPDFETLVSPINMWEKERDNQELTLSISPLACEESPNCEQPRVIVQGIITLFTCKTYRNFRLYEFANLAFEESPLAPTYYDIFQTISDLSFINVTFSGFNRTRFLSLSSDCSVSLHNVDFLDVAPLIAFFGSYFYQTAICDSPSQKPSNFTYEGGSIIFSSPLSYMSSFLQHDYMHSVLISNVTFKGLEAKSEFNFIEADSWVSLELRNLLFAENKMNAGHFVKVASTKWKTGDTFLDLFNSITKVNINISNCVFRNNSFTTGADMTFSYTALLQNIVLRNLSFDGEDGKLLWISGSVSAVKASKGTGLLDPHTNTKVALPASRISLLSL